MRRQHKSRQAISLDRKSRLADMAESKPTAKAARAFGRKAYACCDVAEYMARNYDIKGEIGIGKENLREDQGIP